MYISVSTWTTHSLTAQVMMFAVKKTNEFEKYLNQGFRVVSLSVFAFIGLNASYLVLINFLLYVKRALHTATVHEAKTP